jgi:hypothetical protein
MLYDLNANNKKIQQFDPLFSNCTLDFTNVTAANQLPREEPKIEFVR